MDLRAATEGVVFWRENPPGRVGPFFTPPGTLHRFDLEARETKEFAKGVGAYRISHDGEKHPYRSGDDWFIVPTRGGFYNLEGEWDVENEGVPPDIEVEQTPAELIAGRDPQLERAVEEAMRLLETRGRRIVPEPEAPIRVRRAGQPEGGSR